MATTTSPEQAYPASGEAYAVEILRVYLSTDDVDPEIAALAVADRLEIAADVLGSTIQPSTGRWRGGAEPGRVIELAYQPTREKGERLALELQAMRDEMGLTFFVTQQAAQAMEIY